MALLTLPVARGAAEEDDAPMEPVSPAADINGALDGATAQARARSLVDFCVSVHPKQETYPKAAMAAYVARLLTGRDTNYAMRQVDRAVDATLASAIKKNANGQAAHALDPFDEEALMNAYLLVGNKLSPETARKIEEYMALYPHKRWEGYGAMNYRLMEDGAGFLAAQTWSDLIDKDRLRADQIQAVTKTRLLSYFDEIARKNFHEYGSPIYLGVDMAALNLLANFAKDSVVQSRAALVLDAIYTEIASSWNQGYYINTAGRAKYWWSNNSSPEAMELLATAGWLHFGGNRPIAGAATNWSGSFWLAAPGQYSPPTILREIANDRVTPSEYRSSVLSMPGHDIRRLVCHFPAYSLASQWDAVPNPQSGLYKESRRMMLRWVSAQPSSTFMVCQENPRRPYKLSEHIANAFGYGENPFSQYLQSGRTMIGVCNVPENYPYWKIYSPFPLHGGIADRMEKEGWVFCHAGTMLFAFKTIAPYTWGKQQQGCDVLWSDARQNGWVLETSDLAPYAGGGTRQELERFAAAVLAKTKIDATHLHDTAPLLCYRSLDGHELELRYRPYGQPYHDQNRIDGQAVDYQHYPVMGSPWVHQDEGSGVLTLQHGSDRLTLDFDSWQREL